MERAWVMVVRRRIAGQPFAQAEKKFHDLWKHTEWGAGVKDIATVLGDTDIVVIIEKDTLAELHTAVQFMHQHLGECVRYTQTMLAVKRQKNYPRPDFEREEARCFIAVSCAPGVHDALVGAIREIPGVLVADVVFGKYDILMLVKHQKSRTAVLNAIADLPGVEKTTTMQITDELH